LRSAPRKRRADETPAQAFTRIITSTEKGRALYAVIKVAPGSDVAPTPEAVTPAAVGPASAKIQKLAEEFRNGQIALGKRTTPEQAWAAVYEARENIALRDAVKAEEAPRRGV
jgi:hypothetical protein